MEHIISHLWNFTNILIALPSNNHSLKRRPSRIRFNHSRLALCPPPCSNQREASTSHSRRNIDHISVDKFSKLYHLSPRFSPPFHDTWFSATSFPKPPTPRPPPHWMQWKPSQLHSLDRGMQLAISLLTTNVNWSTTSLPTTTYKNTARARHPCFPYPPTLNLLSPHPEGTINGSPLDSMPNSLSILQVGLACLKHPAPIPLHMGNHLCYTWLARPCSRVPSCIIMLLLTRIRVLKVYIFV